MSAGTLGCATPLAGTQDVDLIYAVEATTPEPPGLDRVSRVRARLGAAGLAADVDEPDPGARLRLRIAADRAAQADALLRWRGGVTLHRLVPTPDGVETPERVERRVSGPAPAPSRKLVSEFVAPDAARVRAVELPPVLDRTTALTKVVKLREGHDLGLHFEGPPAASAIAPPGEPLAVVRGSALLGVIRDAEASPMVLSFGDDLHSYARAERARALLASPTLPPLTKLSEQAVPPQWPLAFFGLFLPLFVSLAWLSFVRRFDRAHPEPLPLVVGTFALGAVAAPLAGLVEYALMRATPYLHPTLMTRGGQLAAFPVALAVFSAVVGLTEEGAKLASTWFFARRRPEFDEPVDGIVYGVAASLGFAAAENVGYFALGRLAGPVVVLRAFTSVPAHMFFGAIWGYAMGRKLVAPRTSVLAFLLLAAVLHGAYDTLLSTRGLEACALVLNLALATLFILLLRRSLRRGIVPGDPDAVPESTRRIAFSIGSKALFALSAALFHLCAIGVVALGFHFESQSRRLDYPFLGIAALLFLVFGAAARGVVHTLPLEAVVDETGVTFGGKWLPWHAIGGFEQRRSEIVVRSAGGAMRIGPGRPRVLDTLAAVLAQRLGGPS